MSGEKIHNTRSRSAEKSKRGRPSSAAASRSSFERAVTNFGAERSKRVRPYRDTPRRVTYKRITVKPGLYANGSKSKEATRDAIGNMNDDYKARLSEDIFKVFDLSAGAEPTDAKKSVLNDDTSFFDDFYGKHSHESILKGIDCKYKKVHKSSENNDFNSDRSHTDTGLVATSPSGRQPDLSDEESVTFPPESYQTPKNQRIKIKSIESASKTVPCVLMLPDGYKSAIQKKNTGNAVVPTPCPVRAPTLIELLSNRAVINDREFKFDYGEIKSVKEIKKTEFEFELNDENRFNADRDICPRDTFSPRRDVYDSDSDEIYKQFVVQTGRPTKTRAKKERSPKKARRVLQFCPEAKAEAKRCRSDPQDGHCKNRARLRTTRDVPKWYRSFPERC